MIKKTLVVFFLIMCKHYASEAQVVFQCYTGVGYMEHVAIGAGVAISNKHSISFFYGSNFFIKPKDFSSYLFQYNFSFSKLKFFNLTPMLGIKGGNTTFTDRYYRWKLVAIIPFIGLEYPVNKKIALQVQTGCAFSLEQSVHRIKDGDIGHYNELLQEAKVNVVYNFLRKKG